jgi:hypothetical protein
MPAIQKDTVMNLVLKPNDVAAFTTTVNIPANQPISQPYWLEKPVVKGLFQVSNQALIGYPENPPAFSTLYTFDIDGQTFTFSRPWSYKSTDPVDGEIYRPFIIQPAVMVNLAERVYVFADNTPKTVDVILKSGRANVSGDLEARSSSGLADRTGAIAVRVERKGAGSTGTCSGCFRRWPTARANCAPWSAPNRRKKPGTPAVCGWWPTNTFPPKPLFPAAEAKLVKLDVKVKSKTIGYIAGAGDEVPAALQQIGCLVTPPWAPRVERRSGAVRRHCGGRSGLQHRRMAAVLPAETDGLRQKMAAR